MKVKNWKELALAVKEKKIITIAQLKKARVGLKLPALNLDLSKIKPIDGSMKKAIEKHISELLPDPELDAKWGEVANAEREIKKAIPLIYSISENKKVAFLKNHHLPKRTAIRHCLHCAENIIVGDFKVHYDPIRRVESIRCPNAPECDGWHFDWFPEKQVGTNPCPSVIGRANR